MEEKKEKQTEAVAKPKVKEKLVALEADFGKVYVRVKGNEIMRPIKAQMALYEAMGHIYKVKKEYAVSHPGYVHLNKVASISVVTPQKVMVDEREMPNPYVERNKKTKMIETVSTRKMGIGLSPMGNIVVVDKTLFYNLYSYFIESIQAKMKKVEWKNGKATDKKLHPNCALTGTEDEKPDMVGKWAFYETVSPLGLWINYEDSVIIDCLNEHTQRQRFGDRIAQTIVERNILKSHPAIGLGKVQPQDWQGEKRAFVTVYGYRHEFGTAQIDEILAQAEKGSKTIEVAAEVIGEVPHEEEAQVVEEIEKEEKVAEPEKKKKSKSPAEMEEPPDDFYLKQEEGKKNGKENTD